MSVPALVVVDFQARTMSRWSGRNCTHVFEVEGEITTEKVENMRTFPDGFALFDHDLDRPEVI